MAGVNKMKEVVKAIIASYEDRISTIRKITETTYQRLESYQKEMHRTKEERIRLNAQLQEMLTRQQHLRRKDFNKMMGEISLGINKRKREIEENGDLVREKLRDYFDEQKNTATTLREKLSIFTDDLKKDESTRIKDFKLFLGNIQIQQEKRENEIRDMLRDFQKKSEIFRRDQEQIAQTLRELLSKGNSLRIRDFKVTLAEIQAQQRERNIFWKEERKKTSEMLDGFHQERRKVIFDLEKARTCWQDLAFTMKERRMKRASGSQNNKNKSMNERRIKD
jgi:hypothetical protein